MKNLDDEVFRYLRDMPYFWVEATDISHKLKLPIYTVRRALHNLVEANMIKKITKGQGKNSKRWIVGYTTYDKYREHYEGGDFDNG